MLYLQYYQAILTILDSMIKTQATGIEKAAALMCECILSDGIIHVFGSGHSHLVAEEMLYRAGGLAPVSAMLDERLILFHGAVKSSCLEQTEGIAEAIYDSYHVAQKDLVFVISTSGVNAVPIEMAMAAKGSGVPVVGVSSSAYWQQPARHSSGKHLHEVVDLSLDNRVPLGDAAVYFEAPDVSAGPSSSVASMVLMNCIMTQTVDNLQQRDVRPPVYKSGNVGEGIRDNENLVERYRSRIKLL